MITLDTESVTSVEWVGIILAAVSGAVHLAVGIPSIPSVLATSFVLAGLGFIGAIVLVLIGWRKRIVYTIGIPFIGAQLIFWYVLNGFPLDTIEIIDKVAQVTLLILCLYFLTKNNINN